MMKKKSILQLAFLLFLVAGTILIIRQQQHLPYITNKGRVFGTYYTITYQHAEDLQKDIEKALKEVDNEFSMFNDSSTVARINRGENPALSPTFLKVFDLAKQVNKATFGAFDITVAPLVNAWGFGFRSEQLPDSAQIDSLLQFVGMEKIGISVDKKDKKVSHITKSNAGIMLDFSAIAKGYGCDVVSRLMRKHSIRNYMIEVGGEVVCHGKNPNGEYWHIGISKPSEENTQELQTVVDVKDEALATSGNYRRFYYQNGQRRAHTIDPRTGYPVNHTLLSATVLAHDCATADAYATAFMVLGIDKAKEIILANNLKAYLIYTDGDDAYAIWENL
ncbi:MAG: FAD:protein FMN transferase [Prevotella sp.]|nr:FAD:protein FMN transferase [Prevotella sp.]